MKETGIQLIAKERERQITEEGWTPDHDDQHDSSEMAWVACYYAMPSMIMDKCTCGHIIALSPDVMFDETGWANEHAKRTGWVDRIKDLVKAGALIVAEIDRLKRKAENPEE